MKVKKREREREERERERGRGREGEGEREAGREEKGTACDGVEAMWFGRYTHTYVVLAQGKRVAACYSTAHRG